MSQDTQLDPLTGVMTRSALEDALADALAQAREQGGALSLAFMDVDSFLLVNKDFGREAGDAVLQELAAIIQENIPSQVTLGRYGGDEFMLLFPDTEREQAFLTMERIRASMNAREKFGKAQVVLTRKLTLSGGVAAYPIDGTTEYELLRKADQALYRAKAAGRNAIRLAIEEKMAPKTSHYTLTQLERLGKLAKAQGVGEAVLLREGLDLLLMKYGVNPIES